MTEICYWCMQIMTRRDARNQFVCTCPAYLERSAELDAQLRLQHQASVCMYCANPLRNLQCTCPGWARGSLEAAVDYELQVQLTMAPDSPNRAESERILNELTQGPDRQWARDRVAKLREAHARNQRFIVLSAVHIRFFHSNRAARTRCP